MKNKENSGKQQKIKVTETSQPVLLEHCPGCGAAIGEKHLPRCDIERCPACGRQFFGCDCPDDEALKRRIPWTGEYPNTAECTKYGFYTKVVPGLGWIPCSKDDEGATEDLNRLYGEGSWDVNLQKWVMPKDEKTAAQPERISP